MNDIRTSVSTENTRFDKLPACLISRRHKSIDPTSWQLVGQRFEIGVEESALEVRRQQSYQQRSARITILPA